MKKILLFLTMCFALAKAQFYYDKHGECRGAYKDSLEYSKLAGLAERFHGPILVKKPVKGVKPRKNLKKIPEDKIQRTFDVNRDSLRKELWLEVEKNEIVKICVDMPVVAWETSLKSSILNDSCLAFQIPTLIGVETVNVYFSEADSSKKINLAVGMKYLDFKNEEVLLGYNEREFGARINPVWNCRSHGEADPERYISVTGTYLVDKRPVTQCEIVQMMWDSIPNNVQSERAFLKNGWISRKKTTERNGFCVVHDSAANTISIYQAMKYANARSIREGLKPYYIFSAINAQSSRIQSKGLYDICNTDFTIQKNEYIRVSVNYSSDGYRLPYYDEWMMFARGGDKKNKAPWGDTTATFEEVSKYAKFTYEEDDDLFDAGLVGQLKPNGYGLYDIFGLVEEHVLFEELNPFCYLKERPSCFKGGNTHITETWKDVNYAYRTPNYTGCQPGGFRLIRNIGNNAKWSDVKSDKE